MQCMNFLQQKQKNSQKYPNSMVLAGCDSYYYGIVMRSTVRHHIKNTCLYVLLTIAMTTIKLVIFYNLPW